MLPLDSILVNNQLDTQFFFSYIFIPILYMFRAPLYSSSGESIVLTLRLLISYIYMEHLFLMFLDHTQRRSTVGRTPLDE